MPSISYSTREINFKVVYYGPSFGGKTTNLKYIYNSIYPKGKGELITLDTKTERTLFFDFLPLEINEIQGFKTRFSLYTVPGQPIYEASREIILRQADGVVFIVDSQIDRFDDNVKSLRDLEKNLEKQGTRLIEEVPLVMQYNKRDLSNIHSIEFLEKEFNPINNHSFKAIAITGEAVIPTVKTILKLVLDTLRA